MIACLLCTSVHTAVPPFLEYKSIWAEQTLQSMTLQEKIAQLFVVAAISDDEQPTELLASSLWSSPYKMDEEYVAILIEKYHVGGVIFLYNSTPKKQMALTKKFQELSKVPLLIAQDAEWGLSMRLDKDPDAVVRYPRNMTLGALTDEKLMYDYGFEIGRQCAALGVHLNCAPVVDVNSNPENPVIHDRSFGDDPQRVAHYGALVMKGLQDAGIIACAKHFLGHGDTSIDSHLALPKIDHPLERLEAVELLPFRKLIQEGVGSVMIGHLLVPLFDAAQPATMSSGIVTDFLKNTLNFQGLVITDGLGMRALTNFYKPGELEFRAFLAGNDILLCPLDVPNAIARIEEAININMISERELDARVLKILHAKAWVLEHQRSLQDDDEAQVQQFLIRSEAYALQEMLFKNALTLVKKDEQTSFGIPLLNDDCIVSCGSAMPVHFFNALKNHVAYSFEHVLTCNDSDCAKIKEAAQNVRHVIIAIAGINKNMKEQFGITPALQDLIATLKNENKTVHIVLFGTPYAVPFLDHGDTLLVAYEDIDVTQEAAADVFLGNLQPQGKLPINPFECHLAL